MSPRDAVLLLAVSAAAASIIMALLPNPDFITRGAGMALVVLSWGIVIKLLTSDWGK